MLKNILIFSVIFSSMASEKDLNDIVPHIEYSYGTILVNTIDGQLNALHSKNGKTKWTLQGDPVLRSPTVVKQGFTFLSNPRDGSLYTLKEGVLKRLPLNIPALVHAAPLKSNDGVLYAGSKRDVWLEINPVTGTEMDTMSTTTERVCPVNNHNGIFVGRTEYRISIFDTKNRGKTWNTTFTDYSAHLLPANNDYPYRHYVSHGNVLAVGLEGNIIWERDFGQPIVAMYLLQDDGLHKLHFTAMGGETLDNVVKNVLTPSSRNDILGSGENPQGATSPQQTLFSTLYVGESPFGLFAMDVMVDKHTITYAPKYLGPPLLEGPSPIALSDSEKSTFIPSSRTVITIDVSSITHKTTDGEFLLLGYHEKPTIDMEAIAPVRFTNSPLFTYIDYKPKEENTEEVPTFAEMFGSRLSEVVLRFYLRNPSAFYLVIFTLFSLLLTVLWLRNIQSNFTSPNNNIRNAKTFRHGTVDWEPINNTKIPDGWINVGKLLYNPSEILGRGCEGTVVYKGKFDGRDVAVKRVISEFVKLVDQEADLLRESDAHPNVIRYFCMESDSQFRYLALELCLASLNDYVHDEGVRRKISILPIELLRQAAEGLAHLHVKQIVHRDMKPHNVLLSVTGSNQVRAVISDFGLCKRVLPGRQSFSKRSGLAGTDGWIAPEMLTSESTSYPVDVFSLGCIFYYVLSNGHHPFGECLHRQTNIVSGHYVLRGLSEDIPVSISLIENMIQRAPELRPSLKRVLAHPFFWNAGRRLQFFGDVSDRVEKEENSSIIVRRLEGNARNVVGANWRSNICDCLAADLRKFRSYKGNSVKDLLRAMRNKKHHYRELPENVRNSLGCIPNQFVLYFTTRFPLLLLHTYEAMEWCADEDVFKSYYSDEVRSRMEQIKNGD